MASEEAESDKTYLIRNAVFGDTRRSIQLERYHAHYECTQYVHLKSDWNGRGADQLETVSPELNVPSGFETPGAAPMVSARRPTAPSNLAKAVTDRFTGLIFSEARRPEVVSEGDPDTTNFLLAAMEQMRFWPHMREARAMGGSTGSVLITVHVRKGKYCLEIHKPGDCQIMWEDERSLTPRAVLIMYKFLKTEDVVDKDGKVVGTREVNYLYRRIITSMDDTIYEPEKLDGAITVEWRPKATAEHNLGVFPGVWIQNLPVIGKLDGHPDCQGAWQMLDTYDRIIAQMNKAILLNLDPTPVIKTDEKVIAAGGGARLGSDGTLNVGINGDAKYMEMQGGALTIGMSFCGVLLQNILNLVRCVFADPATLSGAAQSAKAIEYIYALMLEKADELRAQYGDLGIIPLLLIIELIARKTIGQEIDLGDGAKGVLDILLPPRLGADGKLAAPVLGPGGYIQLKWGPYFAPTEQDRQNAIKNINDARTGLLLDLETAIRQAAPIFGLRDPEAIIAAIRKEAEATAAMGYNEDGSVTESDLGGGQAVDPRETNGPAAGAGGRA